MAGLQSQSDLIKAYYNVKERGGSYRIVPLVFLKQTAKLSSMYHGSALFQSPHKQNQSGIPRFECHFDML